MIYHFGSEAKADAAIWLVLKPMEMREAKYNAPNVHVEPESLTALKGKGAGYLRHQSWSHARRIRFGCWSREKCGALEVPELIGIRLYAVSAARRAYITLSAIW